MYQSQLTLGMVTLNVQNLEKQVKFYTDILGMAVLTQDEQRVVLGVANDQTPLVTLQQVETSRHRSYGLYHLALLLPEREDLAAFLKHVLVNQVPLQGAADHGYSEAIYLADSEGNGIEVVWDKPMEKWDIQGERVIGGTWPIDGDGLLLMESVDDLVYRMPSGTTMGHIHLSVKNAKQSSEFYQHILPISQKQVLNEQAYFLASGKYHHHLAVNNWNGNHLEKHRSINPGLAFFEVFVHNETDFERARKYVDTHDVVYEQDNNSLKITDADGIQIMITLNR